MMVVDASAVLEILLQTSRGRRLARRLLGNGEVLCAPHLLDVEVTQVLRRYVLAGDLNEQRGGEALSDLAGLPIARYPHEALLPRAWELRENLTAYDAMYIVLAEAMDCTLVTADHKLARAPGHAATVLVV